MLNAIINLTNHIQQAIENILISTWITFYSPFRVRNF